MTKQAHEIVQAIKSLAADLGRVPTRDEFRDKTGLEMKARKAFGNSYSAALHAAGFVKESFNKAGDKKPKKFKYETQKLQGFFVDKVELKELFERAGNPDVLKVVAQPDTHVPYHDVSAISAMCQFMRYYKPDVHMIMGDFLDVEPLSHWPAKDLAPRRFVPEVLLARKVLAQIVAASASVTSRFYLMGNHEDWIKQALVAKIPELADGIEQILPDGVSLDLKTFLDLEKFGYELQELNHLLQIGNAYFTHGLYTNEHHPKKHLDTFGCNIYYGHLHDVKGCNKMSITGPIEAQSLGCMCLDAKFMKGRPNNWMRALGVYEFMRDGNYTFSKPCIINGRFSYNGQVFDGNK